MQSIHVTGSAYCGRRLDIAGPLSATWRHGDVLCADASSPKTAVLIIAFCLGITPIRPTPSVKMLVKSADPHR